MFALFLEAFLILQKNLFNPSNHIHIWLYTGDHFVYAPITSFLIGWAPTQNDPCIHDIHLVISVSMIWRNREYNGLHEIS